MSESVVTIITGSSRGFGALTAETLARRGHRVFAGMREPGGRNAPAAARMRTLASDEGLLLEPTELDVTDDASVAAAVERALGAGKYALEALAEAYRYELSELGVDSVIIEPGPFPTDLVAARLGPDEHERVASYGRVAETAGTLIAGLEEMLGGSGAPDPQAVADVIADLIETPPGQRPLRTVVGEGFGAAGVNAGAELHARTALDGFGLGHLAQILTEEVAA